MIIDTFASTYNFFCKASRNNARFGFSIRRAFFMPIRQVFDASDKILSAACLKWYLNESHFNFRFAESYMLATKRAVVFFALGLTYNSIMVKSTTNPTLHTVEVTQCQLAILNHFHGKNATEMARLIRSVCTAAIKSDCASYDDITTLLMFSEYVQELADEHCAEATDYFYHHKKFS